MCRVEGGATTAFPFFFAAEGRVSASAAETLKSLSADTHSDELSDEDTASEIGTAGGRGGEEVDVTAG